MPLVLLDLRILFRFRFAPLILQELAKVHRLALSKLCFLVELANVPLEPHAIAHGTFQLDDLGACYHPLMITRTLSSL